MTDELELARAACDGRLHLLCPEMQLLRCPAYTDVVLQGSGVIRTDERGRLSFELVAPMVDLPHPILRQQRPSGEVHDAFDHVMLRAVDYLGREWRSNSVLATARHPATDSPNWTVRSELETLLTFSNRPYSERSEARLYIPRQRNLPFDATTVLTTSVESKEIETVWSQDHHVRRIGEAEVEFRSVEPEWLTIWARQNTPIMPDWAGPICHALEFTTASTARPVLATREFHNMRHLSLFSGPFAQYRSYLTPPLLGIAPLRAANFWTLVQCFFEFMQTHDADRSTVLSELQGIRSGSSGSIQTACLTLAIGVESLAGLMLAKAFGQPEESNIAQINNLLQTVQEWKGDDRIRERAISSLGRMKSSSAADRLYAFVTSEGLPHELVDNWKKLRNQKAHGGEINDDQTLYDRYYAVVELCYRIVAFAISYAGPIAETSKRGWGFQNDTIANDL